MKKGIFDLKEPKTILVVEAHPDDAALFAGGTIALLAEEGHTIVNLCSTYGEKGTLDSSKTLEEMIETEKRESQNAADVLGTKEVIYLDVPDGELAAGVVLREHYTEIVRRVQPEIVLSFDPAIPYDPHPDHQAVGRTLYEACYTSHFPLYYPNQQTRGLKPHLVNWYYGWTSSTPNTFIDISTTLEKKIRAVEQYESQMQMMLQESMNRLDQSGFNIPTLNQLEWKAFVRLWVTRTAQQIGRHKKIPYAEAFHKIGYGVLDILPQLQEI